jgi:type VI secretion system secreted protein VgrG
MADDTTVRATVEIDALSAPLTLADYEVDERLSAPYRGFVEIVTDLEPFDPALLRGGEIRLILTRPSTERRFIGIITEVETGRGDEMRERRTSRLYFEPALAHLRLTRDTRIFQTKDVPAILEEVLNEALGEYGREVRLSLKATYVPREYCVQYHESDFDFASRLMEEEGIGYYFDHSGEKEVMVLTDANQAFERAAGAAEPIPYETHEGVITDLEAIGRFHRIHRSTTTSVVLRDFDWTIASYAIDAEERSQDSAKRDRESYEHGEGRSVTITDYDAGARSYQKHDAGTQAKVRKEAYLAPQRVGDGTGRVVGFMPGTTFELMKHPIVGIDGEYLLTRVVHVNAEQRGESSRADRYHNRFECMPLDVPYRPQRRTPKPRIPSMQTALVTGPKGEEIHTDEHGRIKVLFHWDRLSVADEKSSCWVRVQQKWAGTGWGFWFLPRIGMEVVVQFIDGDPDRPLVTGTVYNATNTTPYPLPDEKTKSTIKSNSSPGGGGYNELRFEDKAGSEEIFSHAQKDYNEVVENDHNTLVHANQTIVVDANQTQTIHGNQEERVDGNQDLSVGGNRDVHAESTFDETVDGTETRNVSGAVSETFDASETRTVGGGLTETFSASETRTIGGSQTETIGGSWTQTIAAASDVTVSGSSSLTVTGSITVTTPASWTANADGGVNITTPGSVSVISPAGLKIAAPGGVQQVDGAKEVIAFLTHAEGMTVRAVTGRKHEYIAVHISAVPETFSLGGGHVCIGLKLSAEAYKERLEAMNNKVGGVGAEANGASSK